MRYRAVLPGVVLLLLLAATPAGATLPGENAKIAFVSERDSPEGEIYTVDPDGSAVTRLTTNTLADRAPIWAPTGERIAYYEGPTDGALDLRVMNADGSGAHLAIPAVNGVSPGKSPWSPDGSFLVAGTQQGGLVVARSDGTAPTQIAPSGVFPAWSPDGSLIAFQTSHQSGEVAVVRPDGTDMRTVLTEFNPHPVAWSPSGRYLLVVSEQQTSIPAWLLYRIDLQGDGPPVLIDPHAQFADWSPDSSRLGVHRTTCSRNGCTTELVTMDPDGTNSLDLSPVFVPDPPSWAPDGGRIAFTDGGEIRSIAPDGSSVANLTNDPARDYRPDWQRLPVDVDYVRPKGATPLRSSLVIAYEQCLAANRQHGPALAFPSCSPPAQQSEWLTIGTGDSNGRATQSVGSVRLEPLIGNPTTPVDEADVAITVSITDVRRQADLADYTGELQARASLRITDRRNANAPAGGIDPATVADMPLNVATPCATTADPNAGSTCAVTTSMDALAPSAVRERERAIWQLGSLDVYDGGPDGDVDTADNTLFVKQGVFIP